MKVLGCARLPQPTELLSKNMFILLIVVIFISSLIMYFRFLLFVHNLNEVLKNTDLEKATWLSEFKHLSYLLLISNKSFIFRLCRENIQNIASEDLRSLAKKCKNSYLWSIGLFFISSAFTVIKIHY